MHPQRRRAQFLLERKELRAAQARKRREDARAQHDPHGSWLPADGVRGPLSTREHARLVRIMRTPNMTQLVAAAKVGVAQSTVSRHLKRRKAAAALCAGAGAAPAAAQGTPPRNVKRRHSGRPPLLTPELAGAVLTRYKEDPYGGVGAVHKALLEEGKEFSPSTLYRMLPQLDVEQRAVNLYAALNERLIHGVLNHIEAVEAALASGALTHDNLAYADQTPIYICTGHKSAYGTGLVSGDAGDAKGGKKVGNLWAVITPKGCLRAWLTNESGDEETAKQFFMSDTLPPGWINLHGAPGNIFDLLAAHGRQLRSRCRKMILCIDRLGKSGSSRYPVAGHHAPELRVCAHQRGVGLLLLCPKGALVNPIELWNMHVKRVMNSLQPVGAPRADWQQLIRGPRTVLEAREMAQRAVLDLNASPAVFRWAYHERATGKDALAHLKGHAVAQAVFAARAAAPVPPFDVMEAAYAPRCRMSPDHAYPASRVVAETYNVYFWRHHRLRLHAGLPPPFVRPRDAVDGYEHRCRLCKPNTNGARRRDTRCVCCDSCPGVFHHECLGLDTAPAGAWECAACVRGDVGPLRVWKDPAPKARAPQNARKRRRAPDSDTESAGESDG